MTDFSQQLDLFMTIDIDQVLTHRRQIAVVWGIEDIQEIRPDLDDEQAWEILQAVKEQHDCEFGITWLSLETIADDLYPQPDDEA